MKRYLISVAVAAMILSPAVLMAEEAAAKEVKFSGKLTKVEKDGKVDFVVTTAANIAVVLPATTEKLDELVGATVDVVAEGTKTEKEIKVTKVTKVTKAEAVKAAAPAAAPEAK